MKYVAPIYAVAFTAFGAFVLNGAPDGTPAMTVGMVWFAAWWLDWRREKAGRVRIEHHGTAIEGPRDWVDRHSGDDR